MKKEQTGYFGNLLLERGFKEWFLYMFKINEGVEFIQADIHGDLFQEFQDIFDMKIDRGCINIPPRSGKTSMAKYFIAFCLAHNPKCNFIYTSYSQPLLSDIARALIGILENPIYTQMYNNSFVEEDIESNPIDDFWKDYLWQKEKKSVYTNKKIVTKEGGVIIFASVGSSILGFGCGIRGAKIFSGSLILDDFNKPADVRSVVMRKKARIYFEETLLSRLNDSNISIINIQQRLHIEDISGLLIKEYGFRVLKIPLIADDGSCNLKSQYTPKRIKELQRNEYMFLSQYQQEPIKIGGNVIKGEWLKYYTTLPGLKNRFIVADTAMKDKESSDYSVLQCWGKGKDGNAYLIDQIRGKWLAPELKAKAKAFWKKHNDEVVYNPRIYGTLTGMYIEDKVSGTYLIQQLRSGNEYNHEDPDDVKIPIIEIKRGTATKNGKDKYARVMDILDFIASGYVYLPIKASFLSDLTTELESFTGTSKDGNDDQVDTFADGVLICFRDSSYASIVDIEKADEDFEEEYYYEEEEEEEYYEY